MFRFLVSSDDANGSYTTMEITVPPGEGANLHSHPHEEEQFDVLDGPGAGTERTITATLIL